MIKAWVAVLGVVIAAGIGAGAAILAARLAANSLRETTTQQLRATLDWEREQSRLEREADRTARFAPEKFEIFSKFLAEIEERSAHVEVAQLLRDSNSGAVKHLNATSTAFHETMYGLLSRMTLLAGGVQLIARLAWSALGEWELKASRLDADDEVEHLEALIREVSLARGDFLGKRGQCEAAMRADLGVADLALYAHNSGE